MSVRASTRPDRDSPQAFELMLACARPHLDPEHRERINAVVRAGIDWSAFLPRARWHGLTALVYWHLQSTCPDAVPAGALNELRQRFHADSRKNLAMTQELFRIVSLLEGDGIPVIVFKGPVLGLMAYGNPSLRLFADLDVLVHRHDVPKVAERLRREGYAPEPPLSGALERVQMKYGNEYAFVSRSREIHVDLHWRLSWKMSQVIDTEAMWRRSQRVKLAGQQVTTFGTEDLLLYLCVHGSEHCWERVSWIADIAALVRSQRSIDWAQVLVRSESQGSTRMLFLGLRLARDWLGAALPTELSARMGSDSVTASTVSRLREQAAMKAVFDAGLWDRFAHDLRMMPDSLHRVRYLFREVITPGPGDAALLPWARVPLSFYYVVRPFRLMVRHVCRPFWRLLEGSAPTNR